MNRNIRIDMPNEVKKIIKAFQDNGFDAYAVGGCVRDSILSRKPEDWDITTNALPGETMNIFSRHFKIIPTGLKHGTLTLIDEEGLSYEVTTFRIEGEYSDKRHPDEVKFTSSLRDDLSRRDFTINAMAYNDKACLVDYFGGLGDIDKKLIRCVGNANERFNEDALRMMRCVRFSAQLGFQIEEDTWNAILQNSNLLENVSIERIQQEFNKIIINDPIRINDLWRLGLLKYFLPEYGLLMDEKPNNYCLDRYIQGGMCHINPKIHLRLAMLLHIICAPQARSTDQCVPGYSCDMGESSANKAREILKRMRYDNSTINCVSKLIKFHDYKIHGKISIRRLLKEIGEEGLKDLIRIKEADILTWNPGCYEERHVDLDKIKKEFEEVIQERNCYSLRDLKIKGTDLMNIGFKPDKSIGEALNWLLQLVIEKPELNRKDKLIHLILDNEKFNK